jgi:hypothetical protein
MAVVLDLVEVLLQVAVVLVDTPELVVILQMVVHMVMWVVQDQVAPVVVAVQDGAEAEAAV